MKSKTLTVLGFCKNAHEWFELFLLGFILFFSSKQVCAGENSTESPNEKIQTMIFEETSIQGEVGSIRALVVLGEERPAFSSLALQLDEGPLVWEQIPFPVIDHPQFKQTFVVGLPK